MGQWPATGSRTVGGDPCMPIAHPSAAYCAIVRLVKPAAPWRLSGHRQGPQPATGHAPLAGTCSHQSCSAHCGHSAWCACESPAHRVEAGTWTFSAQFSHLCFQLVWHATDRCPGITATTVLTLFGNVPSGGADWRPQRYLYNSSFLEMHEI